MDLSLSPSDLKFQKEVRDWIAANFDKDLRARMALSKNGYVDKASQVGWQKKLAAKGWTARALRARIKRGFRLGHRFGQPEATLDTGA